MEGVEREETTIYKVVMEDEAQRYSIWPADRENPHGWSDAGMQGTKAECVAFIDEARAGKGGRR